MIEERIEISNPSGLHTRPAKRFVAEAKKYTADITVLTDEKSANAKNLLKLLKLGISAGKTITLRCDGDDEADALSGLKSFLDTLEE